MKANKKIGIFIMEDHKIVVEGLQRFFDDHSNFDFRGSAENGQECLKKIKNNPSIDIILMDIGILNKDDEGIKIAEEIIKCNYPVKIIFLTSSDNRDFVKKAVSMDIAYVNKNVGMTRLFDIIKRVYYDNEMIIELGGRGISDAPKKEEVCDEIQDLRAELETLTTRQLEIARLVGSGKTNKEIASLLGLSIHTINTNCKNIYAKLDGTRNELIHKMTKSGLTEEIPPSDSTK